VRFPYDRRLIAARWTSGEAGGLGLRRDPLGLDFIERSADLASRRQTITGCLDFISDNSALAPASVQLATAKGSPLTWMAQSLDIEAMEDADGPADAARRVSLARRLPGQVGSKAGSASAPPNVHAATGGGTAGAGGLAGAVGAASLRSSRTVATHPAAPVLSGASAVTTPAHVHPQRGRTAAR
jgi:hypothetical protein